MLNDSLNEHAHDEYDEHGYDDDEEYEYEHDEHEHDEYDDVDVSVCRTRPCLAVCCTSSMDVFLLPCPKQTPPRQRRRRSQGPSRTERRPHTDPATCAHVTRG